MIGKQILNYTITAHLGQGGMGNVYKATDTMLGREVALKMLHPQLTVQPQFLERFRKEARILAQLLHPNIAVIYNFFEQGGDHYMVMEYVEGTNVDDLLKQHHNLPASFVVPVCEFALEGLQHAHRKNIFHRDIKPANLMITREEEVKLMDFGIAKVSGEQKLTQVNKIVGTIEFMAPELIQGKDASPASDIYSMGATMYEMVTGSIPFTADSDYNLMQEIMKSKPTPANKLNPNVPPSLNDIIMKAMDKDPNKRFPDARSFQAALIAAFPQYRQLDFASISNGSAYPATRIVQSEVETRLAEGSTPLIKAKQIISNPSRLISSFKALTDSNKKWALTAALLLLFLISGYLIFRDTGKTKADGVVDTGLEKSNSLKKLNQRNPYETSEEPVNTSTNTPPPSSRITEPNTPARTPVAPITIPDRKKLSEEARKISKMMEEDEKSNNQPEKPKSLTVSRGTTINLALVSKLDMFQEKKSPQQVTFRVTRPVHQNGVIIIREGANATGTITVGRVLTDIVISKVETVTGSRISVKSEKAHGRITQLSTGASYTASTLGGERLDF